MINTTETQFVKSMRLSLIFILMLMPILSNAQLIGRKKAKMYLYKYDRLYRDGTLLFEIDTRMVGVVESITISNRKRFFKKTFTTYVAERDYQYAGKDGYIIRVPLSSMQRMIGIFSDTATVDIKVYTSGGKAGWAKPMTLDKSKLLKAQYIRFR
jgi:hypothetical protein